MPGLRRKTRHTSRARRGSGVLAKVRGHERLWLLSFLATLMALVVLPAVHTAQHRADHYHDVDGAVHALPERVVRADETPERSADVGEPAVDVPVHPHGRGGAMHFAALVTTAAPTWRPATPVASTACEPPPLCHHVDLCERKRPAQPRAPPARAS